MMMGLFALFVASVVCGGYHVVRHVIMRPRIKPVVSLTCVLLTSANCFFALNVLVMMAPDA